MGKLTTGERIEDLRRSKGLTLKELSEEIKAKTGERIAVSTLSELESSSKDPRLSTLRAIANYFTVSLDYLAGISDVQSLDINVQAIHKQLGLSEQAITALSTACKIRQIFSLWALNVLLQDKDLHTLDTLGRCLSMDDKYTVERIDGSYVREKTLMAFEVQQLISRMIDKVHIDQNGSIRVDQDGGAANGQH